MSTFKKDVESLMESISSELEGLRVTSLELLGEQIHAYLKHSDLTISQKFEVQVKEALKAYHWKISTSSSAIVVPELKGKLIIKD